MARDWGVEDTLASLRERMDRFGENIAPIPLSITQERRGEKEVWCVDVHIKVQRHTEFDINAEGTTLVAALRSAYLGLNNELGLLRSAAKANRVFGVEV